MKKAIFIYFVLLFGCTNNQTTTMPIPQPSAQTTSAAGEKSDQKANHDETQVHVGEGNKTDMMPPIIPPSPNPTSTSETPPTNANATAARTLAGDNGSTPIGSALTYTAIDAARVQYYKAFVDGTLSTDDFARLLFKDPDFNRAVAIVGDLYRQDKLRGSLSPETEAKFQELGQRVGAAVLVYNQRRRSQHYSSLAGGVVVGTIVGAAAGGLLVREEWIPEFIKTQIGDRLPVYARNAMLGGLAGGGTVFVTMETYHIIDDLAHPEHVYNADPLLDGSAR